MKTEMVGHEPLLKRASTAVGAVATGAQHAKNPATERVRPALVRSYHASAAMWSLTWRGANAILLRMSALNHGCTTRQMAGKYGGRLKAMIAPRRHG